MDDIEDRYGGWADYPLTEKGIQTARATGEELKKSGLSAEAILASPLLRAKQTAEEIASILNLPVEVFQHLKERNTYGLLCGVNKDEARKKYPELVDAYENNRPVDGYEPYDAFLARVKKMVKKLPDFGYNTMICVTHGKLLKALLRDVLGKKAKDLEDNCIIEVGLDSDGNMNFLNSKGVSFE